jgi:hypothetical protein
MNAIGTTELAIAHRRPPRSGFPRKRESIAAEAPLLRPEAIYRITHVVLKAPDRVRAEMLL